MSHYSHEKSHKEGESSSRACRLVLSPQQLEQFRGPVGLPGATGATGAQGPTGPPGTALPIFENLHLAYSGGAPFTLSLHTEPETKRKNLDPPKEDHPPTTDLISVGFGHTLLSSDHHQLEALEFETNSGGVIATPMNKLSMITHFTVHLDSVTADRELTPEDSVVVSVFRAPSDSRTFQVLNHLSQTIPLTEAAHYNRTLEVTTSDLNRGDRLLLGLHLQSREIITVTIPSFSASLNITTI